MEKLKLSIVTPSFNQGQFIEETIQSVLNQEYNNLEYFIIDGGSTDNTLEIIKKYENKLTYWISEKDNGQTHAINKGFKMATGDIIAWLNSDDVYCEGALKAVSSYFENHPECQWLAGNLLYMEANGHVYIRKYPNSSPWLEKNAMFSVFQPNVFLRQSILSTIGYPREDFHMTMDYEWFCRIAQKFQVHIINIDLAKFRYHSQCKSSSAPKTINQLKYHKEAISIILNYHPNFAWLINSYPEVGLFFWFRIERIARMIVRIQKKELKKCIDKIH